MQPLGIWQLKDKCIVIMTVSSFYAFALHQNRKIIDIIAFDRFIKESSFYWCI